MVFIIRCDNCGKASGWSDLPIVFPEDKGRTVQVYGGTFYFGAFMIQWSGGLIFACSNRCMESLEAKYPVSGEIHNATYPPPRKRE